MVWPTMSGMIVERRDQVLMTRFSVREFRSSTFLSRWSSTNGPFLRLRGIPLLPPGAAGAAATDDQLLRRLGGVAGAPFWLAPWRHGVTPTGALALTTAERMVDRVHGDSAGLRPDTLPAIAARLADRDQLGFGVADLAEGRPAVDRYPAHLGGRQAEGGLVAFLGHQLDAHTGTPGQLATATGLQLDVVNGGPDGDVAKGQGVARADLGALPVAQDVTDLDPSRGEDVALLSVVVVEQGDAGGAVGVVLDGGHRRGYAVLVALEVDKTVLLLMAAAAVAGRLATVGVAAPRPVLGHQQGFLRLGLGDLGEVGGGLEPPAGAGRLPLAKGHGRLPSAQLSNSGIRCPSAKVTIARLVSARLPKVGMRRWRLRLPLRLRVFTLTTDTLKICSTARRISILSASGWTMNVYTPWSSRAYDFSDTTGLRMTSRGSVTPPPHWHRLPCPAARLQCPRCPARPPQRRCRPRLHPGGCDRTGGADVRMRPCRRTAPCPRLRRGASAA